MTDKKQDQITIKNGAGDVKVFVGEDISYRSKVFIGATVLNSMLFMDSTKPTRWLFFAALCLSLACNLYMTLKQKSIP